ncbi:hypothetical protein PTE31013_04931 [Pandoraea terrigena]|uniref:Acyl-CoA dehydrogenase n=1 Tax=Pandoraea terrigena TaxID=2508292 RepID=A0A5E4Z1H7_9BURK|nr:hypothetical protein PTE31013_04931 [Pandoraea terrigena]
MDFEFTDDQDQLRDAVRKWVKRSYTFEHRKRLANPSCGSRCADR